MSSIGFDILVCSGPECAGVRHADGVYTALVQAVDARALSERIEHGRRKCFGRCQRGPNVYVRARRDSRHSQPSAPPRSALYNGVDTTDIEEILTSHVLGGIVVDRLIQRHDDLSDLASDALSGTPVAPTGGDPLGIGRDVRLAVAMRALDPPPDADTQTADDPLPPTGETAENG